MTTQPAFYECPNCGYFHPVGFNGTCDDIDNRLDPGDLDDEYPDGWTEATAPGVNGTLPNLYRLQQLHQSIDLNGKKLEVGCKVRIYISANYRSENDSINGIAVTEDTGGCIDGILEKIGDTNPDPRWPDDKRPCYVIRCTNEDLPSYDHKLFNQTGQLKVVERVRRLCPPNDYKRVIVNGHTVRMCAVPSTAFSGLFTMDKEDTCPSFRVFRL